MEPICTNQKAQASQPHTRIDQQPSKSAQPAWLRAIEHLWLNHPTHHASRGCWETSGADAQAGDQGSAN